MFFFAFLHLSVIFFFLPLQYKMKTALATIFQNKVYNKM